MAKIKQKGKAGAAKAYITRTAAIKKLQCSLADFRRLCIIKGIFPREPRSRKKANKGSTAPTSFYYTKDIAYLAHEPVLQKLREHKSFAKKLSRALGRGEWSLAKSLDEHKPVYTLDHVIKERYPTFVDALRDIDDALCMISLFATLPSSDRISPSIIENCSRLSAEWQLYVTRTRSLQKVFLSIKGVYYQAEVMDQNITWLVPFQFTPNIPSDVDVRVMLTFLELYQTLLGFVLFKLYTDCGLAYPPPFDATKEETAAGVGAYSLQETPARTQEKALMGQDNAPTDKRSVTSKDVRQAIKTIVADANNNQDGSDKLAVPAASSSGEPTDLEEEFIYYPSTHHPEETTTLTTWQSISSQTLSSKGDLFGPYTFFLSRETPRTLFQFIVQSFGGRIGWPASSGSGSPLEEDDESITHVIIDRPLADCSNNETDEQRKMRLQRKFIQPQWIVDCVNAGKILLEEPYMQGKTLPPHLSPFGEVVGAYDPSTLGAPAEEVSEAEDNREIMDDELPGSSRTPGEALVRSILDDTPHDPAAVRVAELRAEAAGLDFDMFETAQRAAQKQDKRKRQATTAKAQSIHEDEMNKMMMSNKKRKLYEKMKYSQQKQTNERERLKKRRRALEQNPKD